MVKPSRQKAAPNEIPARPSRKHSRRQSGRRRSLPPARRGGHRLRDLHARSRRPSWRAGTPAPSASRATRPHEIIGRHFSVFYTEEDRRAGLPARALETAERDGQFEGEGWRVRKDGTRFWAHVVIDPDPRRRRASCSASPRSPATSPSAGRPRRRCARREEEFRLLVQGVTDYAHLHARPRRPRRQLERRRRAHQGLRARRDHRPALLALLHRGGPRRRRAARGRWRRAAREGRFEKEGWRVRKDGTRFWANVVIDPIRGDDGRPARLRQDHARHHRAARDASSSSSRRARRCSSRRRWRRSASSPAASRTTSTTC